MRRGDAGEGEGGRRGRQRARPQRIQLLCAALRVLAPREGDRNNGASASAACVVPVPPSAARGQRRQAGRRPGPPHAAFHSWLRPALCRDKLRKQLVQGGMGSLFSPRPPCLVLLLLLVRSQVAVAGKEGEEAGGQGLCSERSDRERN